MEGNYILPLSLSLKPFSSIMTPCLWWQRSPAVWLVCDLYSYGVMVSVFYRADVGSLL